MVSVIDFVLKICEIFVIIHIILDLLAGYNVISADNRPFTFIRVFMAKSLDPVLRPLRAILPNLGVVDPSPASLVVILLSVRYALALYPLAWTS
jgi:YggT family protein